MSLGIMSIEEKGASYKSFRNWFDPPPPLVAVKWAKQESENTEVTEKVFFSSIGVIP